MSRRRAFVHRFPARAPDDVEPIAAALRDGSLAAEGIDNLLIVVAPSLTPDSYTSSMCRSASKGVVAPSLTPDSYT